MRYSSRKHTKVKKKVNLSSNSLVLGMLGIFHAYVEFC